MNKETREITIKYNYYETTETIKRDELEQRADELMFESIWEIIEHITTINELPVIHFVLGQEELEETTFLCVNDEGQLVNYYWYEIDEIGLNIEGCEYCGEKAYTESILLEYSYVCEEHYEEERKEQ